MQATIFSIICSLIYRVVYAWIFFFKKKLVYGSLVLHSPEVMTLLLVHNTLHRRLIWKYGKCKPFDYMLYIWKENKLYYRIFHCIFKNIQE